MMTSHIAPSLAKYFLTFDMFTPQDETNIQLATKIAEYVTTKISIPDTCTDSITFRHLYITMMLETMLMIDAINGRERALTEPIDEIILSYYDKQDTEHDKESITQQPNCDRVCPKCKEKKVYKEAVQKRAIDEAVTVFYKCLHCGHGF